VSLIVRIAVGARVFHRYSKYYTQIITVIITCLKQEQNVTCKLKVRFCIISPFNVYFNYLCGMITNYVRWKRNIKSRLAKAKAALNKEKDFFTTKLGFNLRKKVEKCCICSTVLYGAGAWTLQKVHKKYLRIIEMWCWRRTMKIS